MKFKKIIPLNEARRQELNNQNKLGAPYRGDRSKGKNRFERRVHSKMSTSTREYNHIDVNKLFKDDIFDLSVPVIGETDNYLVRVSFGSILYECRNQVRTSHRPLDLRMTLRAIITAFNRQDVYIACSCPDFTFRTAHYALTKGYSSMSREDWYNQGKGLVAERAAMITNPNDDKGAVCKHGCLVISNTAWITKSASSIFNYIKYIMIHFPEQYEKIIYPKIYGEDFDPENRLDIDDNVRDNSQPSWDEPDDNTDDDNPPDDNPPNQGGLRNNPDENQEQELDSDEDTFNRANRFGQNRGRFQLGNRMNDRKHLLGNNDAEQGDN